MDAYELATMSSEIEQKVTNIVTPVANDMGIRVVEVTLKGGILQILAENPDTRNLGIDDCAKLSREVSAVLDVEDPIKGAYRLEVSSPGIDRPLKTADDFENYQGFEAKIEILPPHEGQKRFRGYIEKIDNNAVILNTDQGEAHIPLDTIAKAKLVLTDDLIKKTAH